MVSATAAFSALTVAVLATSTGVDAHGVLSKPGPTFTGSGYGGNFHATVPNSALKPVAGERFNYYPDANLIANSFEKAFKASQYKTLKDFLLKNLDMSKGRSNMPKTKECGFTNPNGKAQALPNQLEWYGGVQNHPGPCEAWCDDTVVLPFTANCAKTFPAGKMTYNKAACAGKGRLSFYWMSSLLEWQVYIQCIKLSGGARSIEDSDDGEVVHATYNATAYEGADEAANEQEAEDMAAIAREYDFGDEEESTESVGISDAEIEEEAEVQAAIEREAAEEAGPSPAELAEEAEVQDGLDREAAEEEAAKHVDDEDN